MRTSINNFVGILFCVLSIESCSKDSLDNGRQDYHIYAELVSTKTTNAGMSTTWKRNDKLNVFHAVAGTTDYVKDGVFKVVDTDLSAGEFTGTLSETLNSDNNYDWYAFYPYNSNLSVPDGTGSYTRVIGCELGRSQTQNGNNSMSHLAGGNFPLYSNVKNIAADTYPHFTMKQVASVTAFNIRNSLEKSICITKIVYFPMTPIIGSYSVNFIGDEIVIGNLNPKEEQMTATLDVSGNEMIESGHEANFYIGTIPYSIENGTPYMITVSYSDGESSGEQEFMEIATSKIDFKSGKIKTKQIVIDQNI